MLLKFINKNLVLLDQAIYSGSSFVMTLVLSRLLGIELFGVFSTFVLALFLVASISQAVLVQPMQTKVAVLKTELAYSNFLMEGALFFTFILLMAVVFTAMINQFFFFISWSDLMSFGLYLCFFILHDFLRKFFLAKGEEMKTLILDGTYSLLLFIVLFLLWVAEIKSLATVFIWLSLSFAPIVIYYFWHNLNPSKSNLQGSNYLKYHITEGKWFLFASVSQWFSSNIFILSSGLFLSIEALGALRLVQTVFGLLNIMLQSVENYIIPKVNLMVSESVFSAQTYLNKMLKKSFWVLVPILTLMFVFSSEIITFMGGAEYVPYHTVVRGFTILYLVIFLFYPIRILIRALALNKSFFIGYLLSLLFGMVTCNYLLNHFGLNGAIIGFIGSQIILCLVWLYYLSKENIQLWKLYI